MRGLWSTIASAVVLIALGAYIYFSLWKKPEDAGTSKQEKVFSVQADNIAELKVKSESGDVTTLKKVSDAWQIVAPVSAKASESDASGIPVTLSTLEVARVIEEKPTDLKEYGLDPPRIETEYKTADGKATGQLLIGQKTATGGNTYAKRGDSPRVFLIATYQENSFNKSTFDLRNKIVLAFQRESIDGLEITAGGKTTQLAKKDAEWSLTKPIAERADSLAVEGLIGRVAGLQMKSIAVNDPTPADLKKYGLDKPSASFTLGLGSARATLLVGGSADDGVYARDAAQPVVVVVDKTIAEQLKTGTDEYRRKDVFDFRPFNATRVEFVRKGQTVAFERVKGDKDTPDKWRRVTPNPGEPDQTKVEAMLGAFADLRVSAFVDSTAKTGLDAPVMVVNAKLEEGKKEEKVSFGQEGTTTYVARPGTTGAAKIDTDSYGNAVKQLDELVK